MNTDEFFMREAIALASKAQQLDEVPVGAVVVVDGDIVGRGFNQSISLSDPSAHAEMLAIREAGQVLQNYRLVDATLYVTLEPCPMCAGLLVHSRINRLVFGASDFKTGACGSLLNLVEHEQLNHKLNITSGVLSNECGGLLSNFFARKRQLKKQLKRLTQQG